MRFFCRFPRAQGQTRTRVTRRARRHLGRHTRHDVRRDRNHEHRGGTFAGPRFPNHLCPLRDLFPPTSANYDFHDCRRGRGACFASRVAHTRVSSSRRTPGVLVSSHFCRRVGHGASRTEGSKSGFVPANPPGPIPPPGCVIVDSTPLTPFPLPPPPPHTIAPNRAARRDSPHRRIRGSRGNRGGFRFRRRGACPPSSRRRFWHAISTNSKPVVGADVERPIVRIYQIYAESRRATRRDPRNQPDVSRNSPCACRGHARRTRRHQPTVY